MGDPQRSVTKVKGTARWSSCFRNDRSETVRVGVVVCRHSQNNVRSHCCLIFSPTPAKAELGGGRRGGNAALESRTRGCPTAPRSPPPHMK